MVFQKLRGCTAPTLWWGSFCWWRFRPAGSSRTPRTTAAGETSSCSSGPSGLLLALLKVHRVPLRLTGDAPLSLPRETASSKRHSEGTFSNDYSKYLETRRVQDFVQWLKNTKRNGWVDLRHLLID